MRIYLDACCLLRPLDDQGQHRVRVESEAVCVILELCGKGLHRWISSETVEEEVLRDPDEDRRGIVAGMLRFADERIVVDERSIALARRLVDHGIGAMDALHLAVAETGGCDVLLTTDDVLLRRAGEVRPPLRLKVANPARWVVEDAADGA
ncbi:MAG: PIN domain-containing protein [Planctomycetota bacterium]